MNVPPSVEARATLDPMAPRRLDEVREAQRIHDEYLIDAWKKILFSQDDPHPPITSPEPPERRDADAAPLPRATLLPRR